MPFLANLIKLAIISIIFKAFEIPNIFGPLFALYTINYKILLKLVNIIFLLYMTIFITVTN